MNRATKVWLGGAITQFINGMLNGAMMGGGTGMTAGAGSFKLLSLDWVEAALCAVVLGVVPMFSNGLKYFLVWFKQNEFPNPFESDNPILK